MKTPISIISARTLQTWTSNTERTQEREGQEGKRRPQVYLRLSNTKTSLFFHSGSHWARAWGQADLCSHQYSHSHGLRQRSWEVAQVQQNLNPFPPQTPMQPTKWTPQLLLNTHIYRLWAKISRNYFFPPKPLFAQKNSWQTFKLLYLDHTPRNLCSLAPISLLLPSFSHLSSAILWELFQEVFSGSAWLLTRASNPPHQPHHSHSSQRLPPCEAASLGSTHFALLE